MKTNYTSHDKDCLSKNRPTVLQRGNQRDQRPVLGTERWSGAGRTTVGGLGGSALTGCCAGVALSNRRDNVGASDTETHTYSATNTHTKAHSYSHNNQTTQ